MKRLVLLILLSVCSHAYTSELVLSEKSLGNLKLGDKAVVSLSILKEAFPEFNISHRIGEGDSPDYHYYEVKDKKGELIFSVQSFIKDDDYTQKETKIDLLVVSSNKIKDEFGVTIGSRYNDIISLRKENLKFGANHHDNHLGLGKIWYNIFVNVYDQEGGYLSPRGKTLDSLIEKNSKVSSISWPSSSW